MQTRTAAGFEWFAGEEPTQNHSSVFATDFLLILTTSYADQGDLQGGAVDDVASWSGSASRQDNASVKYEANRWGDHFQMTRDANGEWGMVLYDATEPRHANFYHESSESSVFNAVTGEFDGSSSVSGDSEVFLTGHEINEIPAEKNRFELNLETIFVDASSSHTPPADEEDVSSEYDDTQYPMNTDPGGSIWGAAASGFVSGFFSRKNLSTAVGLVPILGTVQSAVELATGYDYIGGEEADRRLAAVGLVPGGKGIANGAKGIINAAAPLARQTTILGSAAGAANALRKSAPNSLVTHIPEAGRKFNQIARRGWTRTTINETVNNPFTTRAAINRANNNPATAFFNADGTHVIRDNITGELIQLSDRLSPGTWIPDPVIVNPFRP